MRGCSSGALIYGAHLYSILNDYYRLYLIIIENKSG